MTGAPEACYANVMDQLYQDRILAFARAVRGVTPLDDPTHQASVSNPTCGDRVDIRLKIENGTVTAVTAAVRGCALCEAGAGLLMDIAPQLGRRQLEQLRDELGAWLAGNDDADIREEMAAFAPVRDIKNRHKCVTLAFEAGVKALSENN